MKKQYYLFIASLFLLFTACKSTEVSNEQDLKNNPIPPQQIELSLPQEPAPEQIQLLFAGDIMAHGINYNVSDYSKIWKDVTYLIEPADLAFGNIEAPIDTTKEHSSYPNFNMTYDYVEAAINAGFNVFSLCNNHTNDQGLNGIKETAKTTKLYTDNFAEQNVPLYFAGLKDGKEAPFSYHLIESKGWKILFLPMTELLNRPDYSDYINFVKTDEKSRKVFIEQVRKLREENPCDLFVLSVHTSEPEYTRTITKKQNQYYMDLLDAGVDVLWANHAHIIKDRKYIYSKATKSHKVIMYANGNTISGQRTAPELTSKNPIGERDNTGDGLFINITFEKQKDAPPKIVAVENNYVTTYINTANEYLVKPLNQEFVNYLDEIPRSSWARYIEKRININNEYTKDYIIWQ